MIFSVIFLWFWWYLVIILCCFKVIFQSFRDFCAIRMWFFEMFACNFKNKSVICPSVLWSTLQLLVVWKSHLTKPKSINQRWKEYLPSCEGMRTRSFPSSVLSSICSPWFYVNCNIVYKWTWHHELVLCTQPVDPNDIWEGYDVLLSK